MDVVIFEAYDFSLLSLIEQVLKDNDLPYAVLGGANVGMIHAQKVQVVVSQENAPRAKELMRQILG